LQTKHIRDCVEWSEKYFVAAKKTAVVLLSSSTFWQRIQLLFCGESNYCFSESTDQAYSMM
jgi:hypothetical protein